MSLSLGPALEALGSKARAVILAGALGLSSALTLALPAHAAQPVVHMPAGGDCHALQSAISTASPQGAPGFGNAAIVELSAGTYAINCTVHLMSNVVIQLDSGAHIISTASGYDPPESSPYGAYQDEGHTIFNTAMFRGNNVSNIGFQGGTPGALTAASIDGNGHFTTGNGSAGSPDKLLSITNCDHLTLSGITLIHGGHFEALTNHCDQVVSDHLDVEAASSRDGWNVISVTNATITNLIDHGNDDGLVFKSDWALGHTYPNGNVTVTHAQVSAGCCNALMYGSETCGDFTNYHFEDIQIGSAGKSGIGIISSDGAHESHIFYDHIVMNGHDNAIMTARVWNRKRCGTLTGDGIGSISDVHLSNLTATTSSTAFAPTLYGFDNNTHNVSNLTFDNVSFTTPGGEGGGGIDTVPSAGHDYNPGAIGPRPAYGMFMYNVSGINFNNSSFHNSGDGLPAIDVITGNNVCLNNITVDRSSGAQDVHFNGVNGYVATGSESGGGALRVTTVGSSAGSPSCPPIPSPGGGGCTAPPMSPVTGVAATGAAASVAFSWSAPGCDTNGPASAYAIFIYGADGNTFGPFVTTDTSFTQTGLTSGVFYTGTVIPFDGMAWGARWSDWSNYAQAG